MPVTQAPTRPRRLLVGLLAVVLIAVLTVFAVRSVLVARMMLPRLALDQNSIVIGVAVSPDGRTLFSGEDRFDTPRHLRDSTADVYVWDAASGHLLRRLRGFHFRASGITASPDGRHVAASGTSLQDPLMHARDVVTVWDWRTGQAQWTIPGSTPFCFSPDGAKIGIGNGIYDAANGRLLCRTSAMVAEDAQAQFSPDSKQLGLVDRPNYTHKSREPFEANDVDSVYRTNRLHLWHADTGKEARDFPFVRVRYFDFSRDGRWLVMVSDGGKISGGSDGSVVRRVDIATGTAVWTRARSMNAPDNDPDATVTAVAVSPNGKYIVLQNISTRLTVLDAATGRELFRSLPSLERTGAFWSIPSGLAFSADGRILVSRGTPNVGLRTLVWDADTLR